MCLKSLTREHYYIEGVIATVDLVIFVFSMIATIKHFHDAGDHFTDVSYFHLIHAAYCLTYGIYHYMMLDFVECACDPWNLFFIFYIGFYVLSWERFLRHWKKSTRKHGTKQEKWKIRSFIYSLFVLAFAGFYINAVIIKPCVESEFYFKGGQNLWFVAFPALITVAVDSSLLAYACVCRLYEFKEKFPDSPQVPEAQRQVLLFICLPACVVLAGVDSALITIPYVDAEVFVFLIPSLIMLMLMWKRNYIVISEPQLRESLKSESTLTFSANYLPLSYGSRVGTEPLDEYVLNMPTKLTNDLRATLLCAEEEEKENSMIDSKYQQLIKEELLFVPELVSRILLEDANNNHEKNLVFEEQLHPCPLNVNLTFQYLVNIVLPLLEGQYEEHLVETRNFVQAINPENFQHPMSVFGNLDLECQFEELVLKCEVLTHEYLDFLKMVRVVVETLPSEVQEYYSNSQASKDGFGTMDLLLPLKRSSLKASKVLAHMPINLNIHSTLIREQQMDSRESGNGRMVKSVTVGAPASHALGWKHCGGLKDTFAKLYEMKHHKKKVTHPEDVFKCMQLKYLAVSHGSVVLSEALGALVSASTMVLTDCLVSNDFNVLKQYQEIGLMVHSASLLSTSGKEEYMLNDFIGAYETLKVTLAFEYGRRESRYCRSSQTSEDRPAEDGSVMEVSYVHETSGLDTLSTNLDGTDMGQASIVTRMANVTVVMRVFDKQSFEKLSNLSIHSVSIVPILFNLGVNEAQSVANISGSTLSQSQINRRGVAQLKSYYEAYHLFWSNLSIEKHVNSDTHAKYQKISKAIDEQDRLLAVSEKAREDSNVVFNMHEIPYQLEVLEQYVELEITSKMKNVDLLLTSCFIARSMNGARTTSCKSAKDRTSVFHTLELVKLASHWKFFQAVDHKGTRPSHREALLKKEQECLDRLRGPEGVRLNNCMLNIGRPFYSFNQLQLRALPIELRPPTHTASGGKS